MLRIIKAPINLVKKIYNLFIPTLLEYTRNSNFRTRAIYAKYYDKLKINENIILYESYHGRSITGNPYAIYKKLIENPKYKNFIHVWVIDEYDNKSKQLINQNNRTKFVVLNSREYLRMLTQAKYLINNTSFGFYFQKKNGQRYINTWHGTPLKTLGKDIGTSNLTGHKNIQRNFLHVDYFVSPNKFTTNKLLKSLDIHGLYDGKILDVGYPRIDLTLNSNVEEVKTKLKLNHNKKVVLYAPTWRGASVLNPENETEKILNDVTKLNNQLGVEYIVLLKVHMFAYRYLVEHGLGDLCVPNEFDTNELLSCVDVLITDYSSIFFDFIPTKKPILFYMYDLEDYARERGFYLSLEELPGPLCYTVEDLLNAITNLNSIAEEYDDKYRNAIERFSYNDNGNATNKLIDIIFEGKNTNKVYEIKNAKKKILMYGGGFYNNGITISLLNLSKYIDYDKYDLTIIDFGNKNLESTKNIKELNENTRVLYRPGVINMRINESYRDYFVKRKGLYKKWVKTISPENMYKKELKRIIGNTNFDVVVDFGGYNAFWTLLFAYSDIPKKSIFLHSDMMEEYNKLVNGKYRHRKNLRLIFSLYSYYDRIVSVAKSANEVNYQNLSQYIESPEEKMKYVHNFIDYRNVLSGRNQKEIKKFHKIDTLVLKQKINRGIYDFKSVIKPNQDEINFVNMGRLSPEKGQEKLIYAFDELLKNNPEKKMKLYIIGDGPLQHYLFSLVDKLDLTNKVYFTGHLDNPFGLIDSCDCLVFSSNYEGQGLVVLESLILNKPVIATDVTGVRSILEGGYGHLVDNSVEGLLQGMENYIKQGYDVKELDYLEYNKIAGKMYEKQVFN